MTVLWVFVHWSIAAQASPMMALCFAAWALVEPPRYLFYMVKQLGYEPIYALKWLRYSLFIPLYPLGIAGEVGCLVYAFPEASRLDVDLPNQFNLVYSHAVMLGFLALLYLPGAPFMVLHMMKERRKQLGNLEKQKAP
jgi:very-long-chain (3R)-3-hydroxyacyl-CoA dehydratase